MLAPGDEDTPGLPPYVVAAGKAVPIPYNGSVARLQFGLVSAARVRRWLRDGALRRRARARAGAAEPVAADLHDPRRAAGRDLPRRHHPVAVPVDVRHRAAAVPGEADRPDRGVTGRPPGDRRASRRRRRGHPQRRRGRALRQRPAAARLSPRRRHDRVHRPLRRAPQGHGRARRRPGPAGARPARPAAAGGRPGRRRRLPRRAAGGGRATGSSCSARSATRRRRGCCAASTSTARRTPGRRASA